MDLQQFASECDVVLTIPDCPGDLAQMARELKASWEASYKEG